MKQILLIGMVYLLSTGLVFGQNTWDQTKEWTVYKIKGHGIFGYPPDTLKNFKSTLLEDDSIKYYLKSAQELTTYPPIPWMGGYVVSYRQEGELRKAEVSNYGGLIYDEKSGKTYELAEDARAGWIAYFRAIYIGFK